MTQTGRGVQTATSGMQHLKPTCTGWETWLGQLLSAVPSSPFPKLTGMAWFPAWADVLTEWDLLKALLDDEEKL